MSKSFQMSSNVEKSNKKPIRNLKWFFTWIQRKNLRYENFLSFVQDLNRFRRKYTKPRSFVRNLQSLLRNPGVWFIFYETYLGLVRNLKNFRSEGSFAVSK